MGSTRQQQRDIAASPSKAGERSGRTLNAGWQQSTHDGNDMWRNASMS
mgnify:CR=1 FL=1